MSNRIGRKEFDAIVENTNEISQSLLGRDAVNVQTIQHGLDNIGPRYTMAIGGACTRSYCGTRAAYDAVESARAVLWMLR